MKHLAYINEKSRYILENLSEVDLLNPFYFDVLISSKEDLLKFFNEINIDLLKDFENKGKFEASLSISLNLSPSFLNKYKKIFDKSKKEILDEEKEFLFWLAKIITTNGKNLPQIKNFRNINRLFKNFDYKGLLLNLDLISKKFYDKKAYLLVKLCLKRLYNLNQLKINSLPSFKYNSANIMNTKILSLKNNETYLEKFLKLIDNKKFPFKFYETCENLNLEYKDYDDYLNLLIEGRKNGIKCFIFDDENDFYEFILNMT